MVNFLCVLRLRLVFVCFLLVSLEFFWFSGGGGLVLDLGKFYWGNFEV